MMRVCAVGLCALFQFNTAGLAASNVDYCSHLSFADAYCKRLLTDRQAKWFEKNCVQEPARSGMTELTQAKVRAGAFMGIDAACDTDRRIMIKSFPAGPPE